MRRFLIGLAVLAIAVVAVVLVTSRGEDPEGQTELGMNGFPLRGSLTDDTKAIDAAVAEWRAEIAEDEEEAEDDDDDDGDSPETRARNARRPDPDDDITVLWIGRADERQEVAILESRGLLAELTRREASGGWFLSGERLRTDDDFRGFVPIGVGDAILAPDRNEWRYVGADSDGYDDAGDGLFWSDGGGSADGFVVPTEPVSDEVPIYITGVGGRSMRPEDYDVFTEALDTGYQRAVWLAADQAADLATDDQELHIPDSPPGFSVVWTGEVPGYEHAAMVLDGDQYSSRRAAVLAYGDQVERSEDEDEGFVRLGTAVPGRDLIDAPNTFAAGAYTDFDQFPYLILAGAGAVETVHALIGTEEVTRKAQVAIIDARRFDPKDRPDTVIFGRTANGEVIAPFR
jgi:hypothetical protein